MITQAYLMGALGKAALQQGEQWFVLQADDAAAALRRWHPLDNNLLSLTQTEVVRLNAPKSVEEVRTRLLAEVAKQEALTLALQLMDGSIQGADLKERIAALLAEYVQEQPVARFVENRLLSTPAPKSFQPALAAQLCRAMRQSWLAELYQLLAEHADDMSTLQAAWLMTAKKNFERGQQAHVAQALLIEQGHLAALTRALAARSHKDWDKAALSAALAFKQAGIKGDARLFAALKSELGRLFPEPAAAAMPPASSAAPPAAAAVQEQIERLLGEYLESLDARRGRKTTRKDIAKTTRHFERRKRASGHFDLVDTEALQKNLIFQIQKIVTALNEGEADLAWQHVLEILEAQVQRSEPKHVCKTLTNIAKPVAEIGQYEFAKNLLDFALMLNDKDVVVYNQQADILRSEGDYQAAKAKYLRAIEIEEENKFAHIGYAEVLKMEGRFSEAKEEFYRIREISPDNDFPHNAYASMLRIEGDMEGAKSEFRRIMHEFKSDFAFNSYAEILRSEGNYSEAKRIYEQMKIDFPGNEYAQIGYATMLKIEGNLLEAKKEFEQAKFEFADNQYAHTGYAEVLYLMGDVEAAKQEFLRLRVQFPDNLFAHMSYVNILKGQGDIVGAKQILESILERFKDKPYVYAIYAEVLRSEGNIQGALEAYQSLIEAHPMNVFARNAYAGLLKSEHKLSESKEVFRQVMADFPDNLFARNGYAEVLRLEGNLAESKRVFEETIRQHPDEVWAKNGHATVLKMMGKLPDAKAAFSQIKIDHPSYVFAYTAYAEILKMEGNLPKAREEYEQILIDFPDDLWAKNGHAELLKLEGNYDQSLIRYAQIKNDFPLDPVAFTSYAEVLKLQGKWQEAKAEFLKVRDLFKYDVWAPTGYAEILRAEGNWKEAKSCYVEIIRSFPHNQAVRHAYFSLLLFLGESTDEAPSLPKQPQTEQDYYWVHFHIKRMMWKGQWEEAKKLSDWALKHCPFAVFKGSFRRIRQCIRLQAKEFAEAVKEFNESPDLHPVSHLLAVQALAEVGEQERAYIELTFCKQFAENKIIYDPLCLLSERYQINGLPQKGYSKERLDQEIPPALLIAVIQQD